MNDDDDAPLPPLQTALLDAVDVDRLLSDIAACGELIEVRVKGAPCERAEAGGSALARARMALDGGALGVQLRYRHDGREWWDTLVRASGGVRLVRVEATR